jgi:hypothetical protein
MREREAVEATRRNTEAERGGKVRYFRFFRRLSLPELHDPGRSMAIAEGRTIPFVGPETIDAAVLETFEYSGPGQEIVTETNEFSAVCPYSGLPDYAKLTIRYTPSDKCVELKSLKYYVQLSERGDLSGACDGEDRRGPV